MRLTPPARLLLWDYARGSYAYDLLWLLILLWLVLTPVARLGDPMQPVP